MAIIQIDRLLETCVRRGASDLHLAVGRPPTLRLNTHLRELQTKVLEPEDTIALMKSITPERIQQEYEEQGSGDFGFAYGTEARFRVAIFKQKGCCSMVLRKIPNKILTFEQIGLPEMARPEMEPSFEVDRACEKLQIGGCFRPGDRLANEIGRAHV